MSKFTVAVAGGGIAGLCLAGLLAKQGNIKVDVYEAADKFDEVGVGLTLWGRVWEALRHMDVADECKRASTSTSTTGRASGAQGFRLRDPKNMDGDNGVLPIIDGWSMHRGTLLQIFLRRVPPSSTHLNKKLTSYAEDAHTGVVTLHFADGSSATCDLLVGCDGIASKTRRQMMLLENARTGSDALTRYVAPRWTGTVAYRFLIPKAALRAKNPQHGLLSGAQVYFGKGMHVVGYSISDTMLNAAVSITDFSKQDTPWPEPSWSAQLDRSASAKRLQPLFKDWPAEAQDIAEAIDSTIMWAIHDLDPLPFYTRGRVVLVGDSAHASLPYVGTGAAHAIEDAFVLAYILSTATTTRATLPRALQAYDRVRQPRGTRLLRAVRRALRAFQFSGPEGDDMAQVRRTIDAAFGECGGVGAGGPLADATAAVAWLEEGGA